MPPPMRGTSRWATTPDSTLDELQAHLRLALGREHVDDAVEGLRRVVGVQRREHEVSGLGERQRDRDALEVAHLTDEHDVGVLTQRAAQRPVERLGVEADLALVHDRALVVVQVLDRVLDRDDVARPRAVHRVDQRRHARRLPGAGRSA